MRLTRRQFLRLAGLSAAALALGGGSSAAPPAATVARVLLPRGAEPFDRAGAARRLDHALRLLTGRESAEAAWRALFPAGSRVGIKLNATTPPAYSRPETVALVLDGLARAGVRPGDIVIWERFESDLVSSGFRKALFDPAIRILATEPAGLFDREAVYETERDVPGERDEGKGRASRVTSLATTLVDRTVNIGAAKDHLSAGVSLGLKSLAFGAMDNTRRFHAAPLNCDPAIPDLLALPALRGKCVLTLIDAVQTLYNGGPFLHPQWLRRTDRLYVALDPVACDRVAALDLDAIRDEEGFRPVARTTRPSRHIDTAAALGLGVGDPAAIRVEEVAG